MRQSEEIILRHHEYNGKCHKCREEWPCDTAILGEILKGCRSDLVTLRTWAAAQTPPEVVSALRAEIKQLQGLPRNS